MRVDGDDIIDMYEKTRAAGFGKDVIRRVVRRHTNAFRACYETLLEDDAKANLRLVVGFVIDAEGNTTAVLEWSDGPKTKAEKAFDGCLTKALAKVRFPKPPGGGVVRVRYPLLFSPG